VIACRCHGVKVLSSVIPRVGTCWPLPDFTLQDFVISIATIHHFTTSDRRKEAVKVQLLALNPALSQLTQNADCRRFYGPPLRHTLACSSRYGLSSKVQKALSLAADPLSSPPISLRAARSWTSVKTCSCRGPVWQTEMANLLHLHPSFDDTTIFFARESSRS
jgi:hypothetical protein